MDAHMDEEPALARGDIWHDKATMQVLQQGSTPAGVDADRARRRAAGYLWLGEKLYRQVGGARKEVPPPGERAALTQTFHAKTGHWGGRRTAALLATQYWWPGMSVMAAEVAKSCKHCDRVRTTFNGGEAVLHPLSVEGFCYRWGVDLAGPSQPVTPRGNQYVFIAVEHYTKHIEAIPIPDKESTTIAYTFAHNVLARFGACAEVVTDLVFVPSMSCQHLNVCRIARVGQYCQFFTLSTPLPCVTRQSRSDQLLQPPVISGTHIWYQSYLALSTW